jgi:radical SAM superfamily enzyme YgiQ (UPF0313 family)
MYRPPRFRPVGNLADTVRRGLERTPKVGLVGAAVSDLPGIGELCARFSAENAQLSFSSLRADALTPTLLETLKASGVKTATIAPDAGSERLRRAINKGIEEATFLKAAADLVAAGIPNLKLYFMVGLPTETQADIDAIIDLCKRIKHRFLVASRRRKRIGTISISLNCFVPKPVTPFQWSAMDDLAVLKQKIKKIKTTLRRIPNIRVNADVPRWAYVQALLARGDRRVSDILQTVHANGGNWASALKQSPLNADFYVVRERDVKAVFVVRVPASAEGTTRPRMPGGNLHGLRHLRRPARYPLTRFTFVPLAKARCPEAVTSGPANFTRNPFISPPGADG